MINCTIDDNGQGIFINSLNHATVNLQNLLVTHNASGIILETGSAAQVDLTLNNCDSWGNETNYSGFTVPTNCISVDPLYVNLAGNDGILGTADDDFRLAELSPCIDAGNDNYVLNGPFFDLNGNPRLMDDPAVPDHGVNFGGSPTVDIGACEFQPPLRIVSLVKSNATWTFTFPTASGHSYQPQFTADFLNWTNLGGKGAGNGTVQAVSDTKSNAFRFYRIMQDP
jgi:hypothetical protein